MGRMHMHGRVGYGASAAGERVGRGARRARGRRTRASEQLLLMGH